MLIAVCLGWDGLGWGGAVLKLNASSFHVTLPTRNLFRHGNLNDFHLYHACCTGLMGLDDIMISPLQVQ
jgi:hypothetical protein